MKSPFSFQVWLLLGALSLSVTSPAFANDDDDTDEAVSAERDIATSESAFALTKNPSKKRNYFLPPLVSLVVPGFDQWWEGQYGSAMAYTGTALAGIAYTGLTFHHSDTRHRELGLQLVSAAGGFSAYHSFRAAVSTRKPNGEFAFLKHEETMGDLLVAPFRFDYMIRPTTLIPVASAALLAFVVGPKLDHEHIDFRQFSMSDGFFTGAQSYLAGTWEEAAFRGWLYPAFAERWNSPFLSNLFQSAIFGAAHYREGFIPWPQFLFGFYQGWLTQKREWTISESIFIHTWWDVIIFAGSYAAQGDKLQFKFPTFHVRF